MVGECCSFLDTTPDKETLLKLIDTLRTVTTGEHDTLPIVVCLYYFIMTVRPLLPFIVQY